MPTTNMIVPFLTGPVLLALIAAAAVYLARPLVTPAERAGRISGDAVNTGTMSLAAAEGTFRHWQQKSRGSGERFTRGYLSMGAQPWR